MDCWRGTPTLPTAYRSRLVNMSSCNNILTAGSVKQRYYYPAVDHRNWVERRKECDLLLDVLHNYMHSRGIWGPRIFLVFDIKFSESLKWFCFNFLFHLWMTVWLKCETKILIMLLHYFTYLRPHSKWFRFYMALCKIMFILLSILIIYFLHYCILFFSTCMFVTKLHYWS